eukprot:1759122-Rhodomonas_salina.1
MSAVVRVAIVMMSASTGRANDLDHRVSHTRTLQPRREDAPDAPDQRLQGPAGNRRPAAAETLNFTRLSAVETIVESRQR